MPTPTELTKKSIDICIVTFNRRDSLRLLLNRLCIQTRQDFNLLISDDGSKEIINPTTLGIVDKFIWTRDRGYHRVARFNELFNLTVSDNVLLLDDDSIPTDINFLDWHLKALEEHSVSCGSIRFPDGKKAAGWFSTANLGIRRSIVDKLGLFDPKFDGAYGSEDIDFGLKIKNEGVSVFENEQACVLHSLSPMLTVGETAR